MDAREHLKFSHAQQVTGYILSQTSSGLTVMLTKSREIRCSRPE